MACNINRLKIALHEEVKNITDITYEEIKSSNRYALAKIPEGDTKAQNANLDSIRYRSATIAPVGYRTINKDPRALIAGQMNGRDLENTNSLFDVDINNVSENNCHGACVINVAQGFERIPGAKYGLAVSTQEYCARDFDQYDKRDYDYYFREVRRQFSNFGLNNYDENLLNQTMVLGESNTSIVGPDSVNFTTGGWQSPPLYFLSIYHLREWRKHIIWRRRDRGIETSEDWRMEIEAPEEDWFNAVILDQTKKYQWATPGGVPMARYDLTPLVDPEDGVRGRKYHDYAGIRCYFNEYPIKGYYQRIAATGNEFRFVRLLPWINQEGGEAGLVSRINDDYYKEEVTVEGITYPVSILIPYIDSKAFTRFPLAKPFNPSSDPVNYDVKVVDGPYLGCNEFNDKWKLVARHEFALRAENPELAGFLAYKSGFTPGYVNTLAVRENNAGPQDLSVPQIFQDCGPDACEVADCAACGQVPDDNHQCVAAGSLPVEVLNLTPSGAVNTIYEGAPYSMTLRVRRSGSIYSAATVAYATANGTGTAGTHYTATSGTLTWVAGDTADKLITVPILTNATGSDKTFTMTLSSPTGATLGAAVATVSIVDGVTP